MKQIDHMLDSPLENWFALLRPTPVRNPQVAARGKEEFLAQARSMVIPVSISKDRRHIRWIETFQNYFRKKEFSPMFVTISSIVLALALLFGGTGAAVFAAQDSLPNQPLYQVKTISEDLTIRLSQHNRQRLQLELEYADRRVNEITTLAVKGVNPPEPVLLRLENHLDQAFDIAAATNEADMIRTLLEIRLRLQQQIRLMEEVPQGSEIQARAMETLQNHLQWAELGLNDPLQFQQQAQNRNRFDQPLESNQGLQPGPGPFQDDEPGEAGFSPGPYAKGTPTPNPETCPMNNCSPQSENRTGPGPDSESDRPIDNPGANPSGGSDPGSGSDRNQGSDAKNPSAGQGSTSDQAPHNGSGNGKGGQP
jgi:hypothetical protein